MKFGEISTLRITTAVISLLICGSLMLQGCSDSSDNDSGSSGTETDIGNSAGSGNDIDITDAIFTERSGDCAVYVNTYDASVMDLQNSIDFNADVVITSTASECTFSSNSVPNHNFNDETAAFAGGAEGATLSEIDAEYTVTRFPEKAESVTPLTQETKNAVFLNGVLLDIISAGCYKPNSPDADASGNTAIGCSSTDAWLIDPLGTESKFGADQHNAHTQPQGLYHYHGNPNAMFDDNPGSSGSPVIGFAADGFPVYGSYFYDNESGSVRKALSGYTLKVGSRGASSDTNPGGTYDGTYNDDWQFTDNGDLDECNGMTIDGQYGYYVTDTYPWVMACITGAPHASFTVRDGGPPAGQSRF